MIILFQDRLKYKYISDILLRSLFINYIVKNVLLFCYYSLLLASQLPSWQLLSCSLLFLAGRFLLFSKTVVYVYFQITFGIFDSRICGNVYQSKEGPAKHHQKKHVEKSRHSKRDYLTRQIVTTPKLLELVINGSEKNSETRLLSSQLKR